MPLYQPVLARRRESTRRWYTGTIGDEKAVPRRVVQHAGGTVALSARGGARDNSVAVGPDWIVQVRVAVAVGRKPFRTKIAAAEPIGPAQIRPALRADLFYAKGVTGNGVATPAPTPAHSTSHRFPDASGHPEAVEKPHEGSGGIAWGGGLRQQLRCEEAITTECRHRHPTPTTTTHPPTHARTHAKGDENPRTDLKGRAGGAGGRAPTRSGRQFLSERDWR